MKVSILLVSFIICVVFGSTFSSVLRSVQDLHRNVAVVDYEEGERLRAYEAKWFPQVNPRSIQIRGLKLEKTDEDSASLDVVEFDLTTLLQTTLSFGYFHAEGDIPKESSGTPAVSASLFAFALRVFGAFEFDDNNGIPGYQKDSTDVVNSVYDLGHVGLQWKEMVITHDNVTDKDGVQHKVWYITIETLDEVFLLRFVVTGVPIEVAGAKITPDSVKVDIAVRWFQDKHVKAAWSPKGPTNSSAHPNAKVAIGCAMAALAASADTKSGSGTGSGSNNNNQPTVEFTTDKGFTGFFKWIETADVVANGVVGSAAVKSQVIDLSAGDSMNNGFQAGWVIKGMYFSFESIRPSEVVWDPEVGAAIDYDVVDTASFADVMKPTLSFIFAFMVALYVMF